MPPLDSGPKDLGSDSHSAMKPIDPIDLSLGIMMSQPYPFHRVVVGITLGSSVYGSLGLLKKCRIKYKQGHE